MRGEKLYYVYLLTDPRTDNEVFYCGKGSGDRWKSHLGHWSGNGENNPTANKIKKIQAEGLQPGVVFLHENITCEAEAYRLESQYIAENFNSLTNLKIEAHPPKNTGGRKFTKSPEARRDCSIRIKREYESGLRVHWSKMYSAEEVSRRIAAGDPGKAKRGKPATNRRPIKEMTTGKIFSSQSEAALELGLRQGDIANCLSGRQTTTKGYMFESI